MSIDSSPGSLASRSVSTADPARALATVEDVAQAAERPLFIRPSPARPVPVDGGNSGAPYLTAAVTETSVLRCSHPTACCLQSSKGSPDTVPLVTGGDVALLDGLGDVIGYLPTFEIVIDVDVAQAQVVLVGLTWRVVEEVGRRVPPVEPAGRTKVFAGGRSPCRLVSPVNGTMSTPPSPNLVKNPVTASAA